MDTPLSDSQALPPGTHLHEFVVERVLGSGGFGITYLARDTGLNRHVVIKENLPSQFAWRETSTGTVRPRHTTGGDIEDYEWSMKNFLREAETLASLDHTGIVRVLRKFETNGTAYFVMPFVEGVPFDSLIDERNAKNKPFSQDELLGLATRILDALGYLHDRGIYHRDLKPGNILITNDGVPVLIDFGSARQLLSERSLTVIESPGYTPFEQLQSRGNVGPWSDLYALGATLAKAITVETPPKAADRMMGDPWQGLAADLWTATYADWFLQSIDRAMAVDPAHRWQSAREWRDFLNGGASMPASTSATRLPPLVALPVPPKQVHAARPPAPSPASSMMNPYQPPAAVAPDSQMESFRLQIPATGDQVRPWVRYWARTIDIFLFSIIAGLILGTVAPEMLDMPDLVIGVIFTFFYNFLEPFMVSQWGNTPGKALLRISLRKIDDSTLSYSDALSRVFKVWLRGMGIGIPIIALFTHLNAYNKLTKNGITSWDQEGGIRLIHREIGPMRILAAIAIFIVFIFLIGLGNSA